MFFNKKIFGHTWRFHGGWVGWNKIAILTFRVTNWLWTSLLTWIPSTRILLLLDLSSKILNLVFKHPSLSFKSCLRFVSSLFSFLFSASQISSEVSRLDHLFYFYNFVYYSLIYLISNINLCNLWLILDILSFIIHVSFSSRFSSIFSVFLLRSSKLFNKISLTKLTDNWFSLLSSCLAIIQSFKKFCFFPCTANPRFVSFNFDSLTYFL